MDKQCPSFGGKSVILLLQEDVTRELPELVESTD